MSAWTCRHTDGKVVQKIVPPRPRIPWWKGPGADSEEKQEPASDIDTALVDSLKVLDPKGPIREADMPRMGRKSLRQSVLVRRLRGLLLGASNNPPRVFNQGPSTSTVRMGMSQESEPRTENQPMAIDPKSREMGLRLICITVAFWRCPDRC